MLNSMYWSCESLLMLPSSRLFFQYKFTCCRQHTHTNTPIHFHLHFLLTRDFLVKHVCVEKWANRRGNISQQKSQIKINKICWFFFWRSARLMLFTFAKNGIHECGMCGRWLRGRLTAFRVTAKRLVYFVRPKRVTFSYWCIGVVFV